MAGSCFELASIYRWSLQLLLRLSKVAGWKVSVLLEELGLQYNTQAINIFKDEQKQDWFKKINPNARIPALVDHEAGEVRIFESGAIMWYLAMKHGKFFPKDHTAQAETMSWLMWQMGGLGPMQGQASHFLRFAKEQIPYAINRYQNELKRLYEVLEASLSGREWLANDEYSIADMAVFPWVFCHTIAGMTLESMPNLQRWVDRCHARPATCRGLDIPEPNRMKAAMKDPQATEKAFAEVRNMSVDTSKK